MKAMIPCFIGVLCVAGFLQAQDGAKRPRNFQDRPAVFEVSTDVVNPGLEAFTFTAGAFGNTLKRTGKGSFEPATFRTRLVVTENAANRVHSNGISHYDSYASGYLDGAEVRVYRMVDGELELVREDQVEDGGTVIEYFNWGNANKVIAPDQQQAKFKWADWSRPGSERWFSVVAVDKAGNISEPAPAVRLDQSKAEKGAIAGKKEVNFRAKGNDRTAPPTPANFSATVNAEGVVELSWDAVAAEDLAGYRIGYSDTEPSGHRGIYLELVGNATDPAKHLLKGDMVIVSKSLANFENSWLSNRLGNLERIEREYLPTGIPNGFDPQAKSGKTWKLVKHDAESPVPFAGEYFLEMALGAGDTELVGKSGIPDISTTAQNFYPVPEDGKEYIMEVWMKADRADAPPVVFTYDGDQRVGGFVGSHPLQVGTEWKRFSVRFTGQSASEGHHAYFVLKASGPATFSFDNFRVYRADVDYLDYLPYQYEQLKNSGMTAFRTHGPIKTGTTTYSMRQYLGSAGEAEGVSKGNTLPQALQMMEKSGMDPWLQIEYHMSDEEWLAFAEYMAAPFDPATDSRENKPYAWLRVQQGRQAPWTDAFDRIYFELANETWNGLFHPWVFENMPDAVNGQNVARGTVYGKFHDRVVGILRSSPYWTDEVDARFEHVLGGWAISTYSEEAARASETADYITIAAYNGGWDEGEGTPKPDSASFFNVLSQVNQTTIPRAVKYAELAESLRENGKDIRLGTYEAGPGYALNGLNGAKVSKQQSDEQEEVMKSKLAGTATLDSFLARAYYDFDLQNFFTFAEGDKWKSHAKKWRGGQSHASYLPLEMFNRLATGDMLKTKMLSVPTVDTAKFKRREAVANQPLASVYATRQGDQVNVFCISRRVPNYPVEGDPGYTRFGVQLPFTSAESITLYRMTGSPFDTNIDEEKVKVEQVPVDPTTLGHDGRFVVGPATGGDARGLPPAETFLYVFTGTNIGESRVVPLSEVIAQPVTFE